MMIAMNADIEKETTEMRDVENEEEMKKMTEMPPKKDMIWIGKPEKEERRKMNAVKEITNT